MWQFGKSLYIRGHSSQKMGDFFMEDNKIVCVPSVFPRTKKALTKFSWVLDFQVAGPRMFQSHVAPSNPRCPFALYPRNPGGSPVWLSVSDCSPALPCGTRRTARASHAFAVSPQSLWKQVSNGLGPACTPLSRDFGIWKVYILYLVFVWKVS